MDPHQVEVEASVVIPTDICLLLMREFMHYAVWSVSEKLVYKLIKTHQNIYSSLKCHLNLFEISVATIMRVFR